MRLRSRTITSNLKLHINADLVFKGPSNMMARTRFTAAFRVQKVNINNPNHFSFSLIPNKKNTSKDTSLEVDIMGPIFRQTCRRPVVTTRRHIFTADVTQDMIEHTNPLRPNGTRNQWQITVHNGLPSVADPWFQYLCENNLMAGDEVMFFFRFDKHVWEVIFRKQVMWDEDLPFE
ncbi:hypothetical protein HKD37_05G013268 [Glycine soja]